MSGQQWGSVIGGVIGSFIPVVGTALGSAIGGMIGGAIDPTKVYGPRLTDAQTQTAMDGVIRAYGDGTFPCKGNLIWQDIVKEHKHTDDGKGSGQEQITYTYTRSYAIGVCKGPISGYKIIKRNGKIVFDARTDAELAALGYSGEQIAESRAAQAKFRKVCTLYYGTADQMPDPTMVAVEGVGNVPAYAGTAYIVLTDDETMQGEVAQYEFVVANCGDRTEGEGLELLLVTGTAKATGGPVFAKAVATATPSFEGIPQSTGADLAAATAHWNGERWAAISETGVRYGRWDMEEWESGSVTSDSGFGQLIGYESGWLTVIPNSSDSPTAYVASDSPPLDFTRVAVDGTDSHGNPTTGFRTSPWLIKASGWFILTGPRYFAKAEVAGGPYQSVWDGFDEVAAGRDPNGACIMGWYDLCEYAGQWHAVIEWDFRLGEKRIQIIRSPNGLEDWSTFDILVDVAVEATNKPAQLCASDDALVCYTTNGQIWTSANGWAELISTGLTGPGSGSQGVITPGGRRIVHSGGLFFLVGGRDKMVAFDANSETVSAPVTMPIDFALSLSVASIDEDFPSVPDAPGYYIDPETGEIIGPSGTQVSVCEPTLGSIVSKQEAKRIPLSTIDVSELTDLVTGFRVASPSSPQKNVQALQPGYFFDVSEFDGVMHHPKRGGEDSFALTVDDLCQRDGDLIEWERTQESELLRKLTVAYLDPDTTYTATTQQWERRSGTVKAEGEGTVELPIVGSKDWAAQVAHKSGKVAWAEPDKCKFSTSIAQAKLVTAAVGTITDEAGTVHRVRIERIEDEGLLRMVEARRTRADVYQSTVSGVSKPLPLFPGSDIRGPTDGLLLNLPVIVDSNDVPGIAWAAAGFLSGWRGGTLQFLRAGQWVDAGTVTLPATMGTLLAALPAHAGDIDNTNVLSLRMNEALESVTFTNLLQERNALAIVYPDGTAEIVQFQTATEVAAGEYELTTLIRGRLNTERGDHASGARVVFLDSSVQYATLQPTDLGTTLTYRFVSLGTDPDAAVTQTLDLTTMQSQTEWPVDSLAVEQDGDDYTLTWLARDRLGTDVFPIRSTNWRGYEVSWSYGGNSHTETVLTETVTFTLPGATDVTFSVSQLNLYTGAGPAQTVNIP